MKSCFTARTFAETGLVATDGTYDPECQTLCAAMEALPGVNVIAACSGHGVAPFRLWFTGTKTTSLNRISQALCGTFGWAWLVQPLCECCPPRVRFESLYIGERAYGEAKAAAGELRAQAKAKAS